MTDPDLERRDTLFGRKHTLVKYDRHIEITHSLSSSKPNTKMSLWTVFSIAATVCILPVCMRVCGVKGRKPQQAWREKVAICLIVAFVSAFVVFFLLFYGDISCPASDVTGAVPVNVFGGVIVRGVMYNATQAVAPFNVLFQSTVTPDVSQMFSLPTSSCSDVDEVFASLKSACMLNNTCLSLQALTQSKDNIFGLLPFNVSNGLQISPRVRYSWPDLAQRNLLAFKNQIIDINYYIANAPIDPTSKVDTLLRQANQMLDATLLFATHADVFTPQINRCLSEKYFAGDLLISPVQCIIAQALRNVTLFVVLAIVVSRFTLALLFTWVLSKRLSKTPSPASNDSSMTVSTDSLDIDTVFLVTCYSEGRESIKTTLDSLVATDYPDDRKLLFVVADGLIVGKGNDKSTPQIILDLLTIDASARSPLLCSYFAVASGSKMHNMAKVYHGYYSNIFDYNLIDRN